MTITLPVIIAISAAPIFFILAMHWRSSRPQHAEAGEDALTVWQLIAHVEAERQQSEQVGRHRLREPTPDGEPATRSSTQDIPIQPSLETQRRTLEALYSL